VYFKKFNREQFLDAYNESEIYIYTHEERGENMANQNYSISCCKCQNISTRDHAIASSFNLGFNAIYQFVTPN